jgi:hypothetical protein
MNYIRPAPVRYGGNQMAGGGVETPSVHGPTGDESDRRNEGEER